MIYQNVRFYQTCSPSRDGQFLKDYREESFHKPMFAAPASATENIPSFGNPTYEFENLTPRKGHEFDEMEIPISFDLMDPKTNPLAPTFLIIRNGDADNPVVWLAGWIDEAEPVATRGPSTNTRIHWHIDHWMSLVFKDYLGRRRVYPSTDSYLTFGPGRFKRGPASLKRPEPSEPRMWKIGESVQLTNRLWVIVSYTITDPNTHQTTISYCNWEPGVKITYEGAEYDTPSWDDVYGGLIEERLGLDSNAVLGAWVSPIAGNTSEIMPAHGGYTAYKYANSATGTESVLTFSGNKGTTDDTKYVFVDATGTEIFTCPWGIQFHSIHYRVDVGTSGANLQVYLADRGDQYYTYGIEGRFFSFPLPNLPVTENAWQSYNYSGEREYDIRTREIQRNQAGVNGIAGIGSSALGGAIAGSIVPGIGTAVGAAAGLISGAISTTTNYVTSGVFDKKSQEATDKLISNQIGGLIVTAKGRNGIEPLGKNLGWILYGLVRDPVSSTELAAEHQELGYITDCYAASCDTLIRQGGGMRIEGLEVQGWGSRDRQARDYISAMFARGVHIDII